MHTSRVAVIIPVFAAVVEAMLGRLSLPVAAVGAAAALSLSLSGRQEACFPAVYGGLLIYGLLAGRGSPGLLGAGFLTASLLHILLLDAWWRRLYRGFVEAGRRLGDLVPDSSAAAAAVATALLSYLAAGWGAAALQASRLPGLRALGAHYADEAGQAALMLLSAAMIVSLLSKAFRLYDPFPPVSLGGGEEPFIPRLSKRLAGLTRTSSAYKPLSYVLLFSVLAVAALRASWLAAGLAAGYVSKRLLGRRIGGTAAFVLGAAAALLLLAGPDAGRELFLGLDASAKSFEALLRGVMGG